MKELHTKSGKKILIDDEDYDRLSKHSWYIDGRGYASTSINKKIIKLHRFLLEETNPKVQVDHINGNRLDDQKINLRKVSNKTNAENIHKKKGISSRYFGVVFDNRKGNLKNRWIAYIKNNYVSLFLGRFLTENEAGAAYNLKAEELGYLTRNIIGQNNA